MGLDVFDEGTVCGEEMKPMRAGAAEARAGRRPSKHEKASGGAVQPASSHDAHTSPASTHTVRTCPPLKSHNSPHWHVSSGSSRPRPPPPRHRHPCRPRPAPSRLRPLPPAPAAAAASDWGRRRRRRSPGLWCHLAVASAPRPPVKPAGRVGGRRGRRVTYASRHGKARDPPQRCAAGIGGGLNSMNIRPAGGVAWRNGGRRATSRSLRPAPLGTPPWQTPTPPSGSPAPSAHLGPSRIWNPLAGCCL